MNFRYTKPLLKSGCSLAILAIVGCATTRVVKTQPGSGGEIMVHEGMIGDARGDANKKMKANCGRKKPVVTEEGEAVIGSHTNADTSKQTWGLTTSARTEQETEWRVKYKCR